MSAPNRPSVESVTEYKAVEDLIQTLTKGLRAIQLYLPNNPMYEQARQNVVTGFEAVWRDMSELVLDVTDTEVRCDGQLVYAEPKKSDSIAWLLHKDGVRAMQMTPGVEEGEIVRFLEVVNRVRTLPPEGEDDLLTLLWEEEFQHLQYETTEVGDEDGKPLEGSGVGPDGLPPAAEVRAEVHRQLAAASGQSAQQFVSADDFDSSLYELEPDELEYLNRELEREYDQDLRTNVLAILCDIYEFQSDPERRSEVLNILGSFVHRLLAAGDYDSVVYLLRETQAIRKRGTDLTEEQAKALDQLPGRMSEPAVFGQLLTALEQGGANVSDEELERLFGGLRPDVFQTALEWLPQLVTERVRSLLEDALIKLAIANPAVVTDALESRKREVAHMAVGFAKTLALPEVVPPLGRLLEGSDQDLRQEVVRVLEVIGSAEAMRELEKALEDSSRDIRLAAIRVLVAHDYKDVLPKIEAKVTNREFRNNDLTEKKEFLEAYGALAGPQGVGTLARMVLPRGFMKRKEDPQVRACAAMGLGKIASPEAKAVLMQVAADKDALVRNAANQALRDAG